MLAKAVTIAFVGDIMLGRQVSAAGSTMPPEAFWGDVLPILRRADAVFANLECPITAGTRRWKRCWKAFRFRAEPRMTEVLKAANVRFVSLANNHMLDCEVDGLADTLAHLDAAGIAHAGAGGNSVEAMRPALLDIAGVRVGALSITDNMPEFAAGPTQPGTNFMRIRDDHATLGLLALQIEELRRRGALLIVMSAHWGPNLRPWPPARFRRFARAALELGVNVFHGHSAHILQGVELAGDRAILYDTGNILDDYWIFPGIRTDRSCVFLADFVGGSLHGLRAIPVSLQRGGVRLARGKESTAIASRLLRLSRPYATAEHDTVSQLCFQPNGCVLSARGEATHDPDRMAAGRTESVVALYS